MTTAPFRLHGSRRRALLAALAALALLAPPAAARDDARATAACGRGASAELRVKRDHGALAVELRVRRRRVGERWSVTLIHERRVVWRGRATTRDDGFRVRRTLPDYAGADEISARATNPRGLTCQASATLRA
jgi:hypothetical protein